MPRSGSVGLSPLAARNMGVSRFQIEGSKPGAAQVGRRLLRSRHQTFNFEGFSGWETSCSPGEQVIAAQCRGSPRFASSTETSSSSRCVVVLVLRSATWLSSYQTGVLGTRFSRCYAAVDARDARSGARAGSLSLFNCNRKSKASSLWGTGISDRSSKNRRRSPTSSQIARVWISLQVQEPGSGIPSSPYQR